MTNADVIRQMTDEELYKFLQAIEVGDIDYSLTFCSLCKKDNQLDCDECFKRWLFNDAHDYNGLLKDKGINSGYADRKTENSSEKPNNCELKICDTCRYYNSNIPCGSTPSACKEADKFAEEFVRGLKKNLKPQINADQHVQHVESVEPTWTKEEHEAFYTFLWNVINPNEMQDYIGMFKSKDEPQTDCAWKQGR